MPKTATTAVFQPGPYMAVYYATKSFVLSFSQAIASELEGTGVTVTALCPGPTASGFQDKAEMGHSALVKGKKLPTSEEVAAVGLLAIGIGAWLWLNGHRLKSMAFPLILIALMQMVVGGSVYLRTDAQLAGLSAQFQSSPAAVKVQETARMQTVMKNFSIYKAIEMVLLVGGVGMIAFLQRSDLAAGIGVGLVLQAAFTLALDIFAEARGADYLSALQAIPA